MSKPFINKFNIPVKNVYLTNTIPNTFKDQIRKLAISGEYGKLEELFVPNNKLKSLPVLPNTLLFLNCRRNQLTSLPVLPSKLEELICDFNQLTSLPVLPSKLQDLDCGNNQLTSLPVLL